MDWGEVRDGTQWKRLSFSQSQAKPARQARGLPERFRIVEWPHLKVGSKKWPVTRWFPHSLGGFTGLGTLFYPMEQQVFRSPFLLFFWGRRNTELRFGRGLVWYQMKLLSQGMRINTKKREPPKSNPTLTVEKLLSRDDTWAWNRP